MLQHAEIFVPMHQELLGGRPHAWLRTTAKRQLLHRALAESGWRLIPQVRARRIDRVSRDDRLVVGDFAEQRLAIQQRSQTQVRGYVEILG